MQCYNELTAPTAVSHSLSLPFLSASANNLVVAKTSLLQIFSLKSVLTDTNATSETSREAHKANTNGHKPSSAAPGFPQRGERVPTTKLVLIAQYELSGVVISLARVKILHSKSGGEALLVSLRDAKLSLVEWDPERYSISTISIHLYEQEDAQGNPWEPGVEDAVNYLSADPRSRCAALKFGVRRLAILPFYQPGDDLVMDDYDPDIDGEKQEPSPIDRRNSQPDQIQERTPYGASFVVSMLALDPSLLQPIHLAFLYEYQDPTFGILSTQIASTMSLLHERRDTVSFTVITLDLEQRASTTLLSINNLPYDLFQVVPVRLPVAGAILVGGNEVIHVDQAGKTNGVAVNEFAKISTSFALADQSDLQLRLEGCVIEQLGHDSTDLLIMTSDGELAIISFRIDGRSISGLTIRQVAEEDGGSVLLAGPSCASLVGRGRMFVGSEDADSVVLGWSRKVDKMKRQRSITDMRTSEDLDMSDLEEDMEDDDDLYAGTVSAEQTKETTSTSAASDQADDYRFRAHDHLENHGPIQSISLGRTPEVSVNRSIGGRNADLELLATSGRFRASGLTTFRRQIKPHILEQHLVPNIARFWTVSANTEDKTVEGLDNYLISSTGSSEEARSVVYSLASSGFEEVQDTDFEPDAGLTIDVGTLNNGSRIVQVMPSELRVFDADFGLAQIFPMTDEATGAEPKVVSSSFTDPYVLLVRDDESAMVLRVDESGDLDEVEQGDDLRKTGFRSGSLYEDSNDVFRLESEIEIEDDAGNVLMFLLTVGGGLQIFRLPSLEKCVYKADGLAFLPPFLTPEFWVRRSQAREDLTELLVAELGDASQKAPYLILRSSLNDFVIYQPYQSPVPATTDTSLHFLKTPMPFSTKTSLSDSYEDNDGSRMEPMRAIHDLIGYSVVYLPGDVPTLVIKSASSPPQLINVGERNARSFTAVNTNTCEKGFAYIDQSGSVSFAQLPADCHYHTGWVTRKIPFGEDVHAVDLHEPTATYVVGVSRKVDFKLPEDETHPEWAQE
ncbi:MAG: hypothetical protein Q9222_007636, partial [Ikaeria aurantiellina]